MLRVLFVGFNRQYVNRTFSVLLRSVQAHHELDFFGPGFQDDQAMAGGPDKWIETKGPYDLVLFESYTLEHDAITERPNPFAGDCLNMSRSDFITYGPALREFVRRYAGPKVFVANWDVYAITARRVEELAESGAYVCDGSFSKLSLEEKEDAFRTKLRRTPVSKGFIGGTPTDHWVDFIKASRNLVLEVPHTIGLEQTSYTPVRSRPTRFVVPGTNYAERTSVYRFLTGAQRFYHLSERIRDRAYARTHAHLTPAKLRELHSRYDAIIAQSCMAYASGSAYRSPVRKYFEIPALGAAAIGQVVEGFAELGFVNGRNFLVAETPKAVEEMLRGHALDEIQGIASRARQLIIKRHSEPARGEQLKQSFERICAKNFNGSLWKDGEYHHR